jgi:hypothetical protein
MAGKKDFSFIRAQLKKNGNKAKADFSKGYLVTKGDLRSFNSGNAQNRQRGI